MRDRYSLVVGLIFLALIVFAAINTLSGDEGGGDPRARQARRPAGRCRSSPSRRPPAQLEGDANVAQDDCETSAVPCPKTPAASPPAGSRTPGAIRVCDFFDRPLVISFWFTKGGDCVDQQDVVERRLRRYRGRVNFLSLDIRDDRDTVRELIREHGWTMPVGYDRDGAVAGLYRVGGCPTFAYVYPGGTLQSASIGELTAAAAERPGRAAAARDEGGGGELRWPAAPRARMGWEPAPRAGLGRAAPRRRVPRPRDRLGRGRRQPGQQPGAGPPPPARPLRPLLRRPGDPHARTADPLGLPRLLPPDRPRPRPHPHAGRAARPRPPPRRRLQQPRPARRRADDRDRRDRGRPARLRRRPPRRAALHPRLGAGGVAARAARRAGAGDADDRRRGAARSGCSSAPPPRAAGSSRGRRRIAIVASRSRACRRSRSTRRCGWPPSTLGGRA